MIAETPLHRGRNDGALPFERLVVDAGATTGDRVGRRASEQRDEHGCGSRVADAHVARYQQVGPGIDLFIGNLLAGRDSGGSLCSESMRLRCRCAPTRA